MLPYLKIIIAKIIHLIMFESFLYKLKPFDCIAEVNNNTLLLVKQKINEINHVNRILVVQLSCFRYRYQSRFSGVAFPELVELFSLIDVSLDVSFCVT